MQNLKITDAVAKKLKDKHGVDRREVEHCFVNRLGASSGRQTSKAQDQPADPLVLV